MTNSARRLWQLIEPLPRLGDDDTARLLGLLAPITRHVVEAGEIPYPNPIGVTPP